MVMFLDLWLMQHGKYFSLVIFWTVKAGSGRKIAAFMKLSVFQTSLYFVILSNTVELKNNKMLVFYIILSGCKY